MFEEINREVEVNKRFKSLARGETQNIQIDQKLKNMIGDVPSIQSNYSSKSVCNSSNYSIPEVPECEDQATGSQFSNFILSSGGVNAICASADKLSAAIGSQQDINQLTGSLSNRDRIGTIISNYISEEQHTDTYRISDDSLTAAQNNPIAGVVTNEIAIEDSKNKQKSDEKL